MPYAVLAGFNINNSAKSSSIDFTITPVIDDGPIILGLRLYGAFTDLDPNFLNGQDIKQSFAVESIGDYNSGGARRTPYDEQGATIRDRRFYDFPFIIAAAYYQNEKQPAEIITDAFIYSNPAYAGDPVMPTDSITVTPPVADLYQFHITTSVTPDLPNWIVDWLRGKLYDGGWLLSNIYKDGDGYTLDLEKQGSITLLAILAVLVVAMVLVGVGIINWRIVRVSDNAVQQGDNITQTVSDIRALCEQGLISSDECEQAISTITSSGFPDPTDTGDGLGNIGLGVGSGAILAIILVAAASRK